MQIYLALIADVIGSRQSHDRAWLQNKLTEMITGINERWSDNMAADFILTIGDEFQGLLRTPTGMVNLLGLIQSQVLPAHIRFGLGIGTLNTALRPVALGMDGPCFYNARAAIERAKSAGTSLEVVSGGTDTPFQIFATLSTALTSSWTERQRSVVNLTLAGISGQAIAGQLAITPSAVSQHLHAACGPQLIEAAQNWQIALNAAFSHAQEVNDEL